MLALSTFGASPKDLPVDQEKQAFVADALAKMGLHNEVAVVIDPTTTGCAYATTVDGAQFIGVDPKCLGPLRTGTSYDWFVVGVLGHEIGHLLNRHDRSSNPPEEIRADEFAGWIMARLGATLDEARVFARRMDETGGHTHPPRYARVTAVELGWTRAQAFTLPGHTQAPSIPVVVPPSAPPPMETPGEISAPPVKTALDAPLPPLAMPVFSCFAIGIIAIFIANVWKAS